MAFRKINLAAGKGFRGLLLPPPEDLGQAVSYYDLTPPVGVKWGGRHCPF